MSKKPEKTPKPAPKRTTPLIVFWALLPLAGHVVLIVITMAFVLRYVDGRSFAPEKRGVYRAIGQTRFSWRDYTPLQSDITTIVSALVSISRTLGVITMTDIFLKSVLILLEKSGLTARQVSRMVMLGNVPLGKYTLKGKGSLFVWAIGIALLLPFPAQLSSPILTGAIAWVSSHKLAAFGEPLEGISNFTTDSIQWSYYQSGIGQRHLVSVNAARIGGVAWGSRAPNHLNIKRDLPTAILGQKNITDTSVIHNLTIPYISLSNLRWVTDLNTIPSAQREAVDPAANLSLITSMIPGSAHPLYTFPQQAKVILIPPEPWGPQKTTANTNPPGYAAPPARKFDGTMYIAALAGYFIGSDANVTCSPATTPFFFGTYPQDVAFYAQQLDEASVQGGARACIVFATVDVVAGVTECSNCQLEGGRTAVLERAPPFVRDESLVSEALHLTADTAATMVEWNISIPSPWENIDAYVKTTLERAYVASWQSLTEYVGQTAPPSSKLSSTVELAVPALEANVNHWRVWIWLGLQILVWVSAFIFYVTQSICSRPMSGETFLSILLMDSKSLGPGVSDYTKLSEIPHDELGRLDLVKDDASDPDSPWKLQPEHTPPRPPLSTKTTRTSGLQVPTVNYQNEPA